MSPQLQQVLSDIDRLSPTDRIQVMSHVIESIREYVPTEPVKSIRKWSDLKGMAIAPLTGEDAQEWVSSTRQSGAEHRESLLRVAE
jgi:phage baseplate assembly protein W